MKKEYEIPEFVVYCFDNESVIMTSYGDNEIEDQWGENVPEI